jgi:hypothetical protein
MLKLQVDNVVISGPSLASMLTMAGMNRSNGLAVWIGQETSVTKACITDQDADGTKTEKNIVLQVCMQSLLKNLKCKNFFVCFKIAFGSDGFPACTKLLKTSRTINSRLFVHKSKNVKKIYVVYSLCLLA